MTRSNHRIVLVLITVTLVVCCRSQPSINKNAQIVKAPVTSDLGGATGPPFQMDVNFVEETRNGPGLRFVTGFLGPDYFTSKQLAILFPGLGIQLPEPECVEVRVFSNQEMLRRESSYLTNPPIGNRLFGGSAKPLPARTGYFYAYYRRDDKQEFFDYTPDPSKAETVRVQLGH